MDATTHHDSFGSHPLTGQLVSLLRHSHAGLTFAETDLATFRDAGTVLPRESLSAWVRDLCVLVVTLRNDIVADHAANQLEGELIEPLCACLDRPAFYAPKLN